MECQQHLPTYQKTLGSLLAFPICNLVGAHKASRYVLYYTLVDMVIKGTASILGIPLV